MVNKGEVLDAIEIAYYVPALVLSIFVVVKHGAKREAGWVILTILSLARVISGTTGIAAVFKPSVGLITASLVTASIGSAALVGALTGIANRINRGTGRPLLPPRIAKLLQLMMLAAIILAIIGGIDRSNSDPSTQASGYTYSKVSSILILVQFLASSAITVHSFTIISSVQPGDRKLLYLSLAALPFILVRTIYSILSNFDHTSTTFNLFADTTSGVVVRAIMELLMEFIAVTLFLIGGFVSPKVEAAVQADSSNAQYGNNAQHGETTYPKTGYAQTGPATHYNNNY